MKRQTRLEKLQHEAKQYDAIGLSRKLFIEDNKQYPANLVEQAASLMVA